MRTDRSTSGEGGCDFHVSNQGGRNGNVIFFCVTLQYTYQNGKEEVNDTVSVLLSIAILIYIERYIYCIIC